MKTKVLFFVILVFVVVSLATTGLADKKQEEKDLQGKSLILKGLLQTKNEDLPPPRRNIFSPASVSSTPVLLPSVFKQGEEGPEGELTGAFFRTSIKLRYIGYVDSDQKTIALVIFEGQAMAVAEGEMIREGIKVEKITPSEVEIIGPDSEKRKFPLEGEER